MVLLIDANNATPFQVHKAVGEISASLVCPYPPGIPILVPGEEITSKALTLLDQLETAGCTVSGYVDSAMRTIQVVDA